MTVDDLDHKCLANELLDLARRGIKRLDDAPKGRPMKDLPVLYQVVDQLRPDEWTSKTAAARRRDILWTLVQDAANSLPENKYLPDTNVSWRRAARLIFGFDDPERGTYLDLSTKSKKQYDVLVGALRIEAGYEEGPFERQLTDLIGRIRSEMARYLLLRRDSIPRPAAAEAIADTVPDVSMPFSVDPPTARRSLGGLGLAATLRHLYPQFPLLEFGSTVFPIWAELAWRGDRNRLNAALGKFLAQPEPSFHEYDAAAFGSAGEEEYAHLLASSDPQRSFNGPTYALEQIERQGPGRFVVHARPGTYFDSKVTSEALERELLLALAQHPDRVVTLDDLPRRRRLHELVEERGEVVPFCGVGRSSALSVAAAIIFQERDDTYSALLSRRSDVVSTHGGFAHVAPSGILAPLSPAWRQGRDEYSVEDSILREFAEELFGYDYELAESDRMINLKAVPPVAELLQARDDGLVTMQYAGLSVPLTTLRPEIYVVILVHNIDWFEDLVGRAQHTDHPLHLNWEYGSGQRYESVKLEFDEELRPLDRHDLLWPTEMVPHAAAALALGTAVLKDLGVQRAGQW